jgi:hypothetical protein
LPGGSRNEHFVRQFLQTPANCGLIQWQDQRWSVDPSGEIRAAPLTAFRTACLPAEESIPESLESFPVQLPIHGEML